MPPASEHQSLVSLPPCCGCYSCQWQEGGVIQQAAAAAHPSLSRPQAAELPRMGQADFRNGNGCTSSSGTGIKGPHLHPGDQSAINLAGKAAVRRHSGDTSLFRASKDICYPLGPPRPEHQGLSAADGQQYRRHTPTVCHHLF